MLVAPGTRLGDYEILAPIGAGGMGEVYRARDTKLRRDVALKVLPAAVRSDADRRARFDREAHVLASLNHPNIAAIHGIAEAAGVTGLVLELVEGPTLDDRIATAPLSIDETLKIAAQIADALDAAHEKGIVHRDLKPANIKVTDDGRVKVLDFGLAKALSDETSLDASMSPTLTAMVSQVGVVLGTAAYMSPEQAKGKSVDKRTDIWAFGCVLFEMLTGRRAFPGEDVADFIAAVLTKEPDWSLLPSTTPRHIVGLLKRCLKKDPRERLRDIGDARLELSKTPPADAVDSSERVSRASGATSFRRRSMVLPVVIAAVIALAVGIGVGLGWRKDTAGVSEPWAGTRLGGPPIVWRPRLSPDGQLVAFLTFVDGMTQVGVMKTASSNWTPLTDRRDRGGTEYVSWSADGTRIYYDGWADTPKGVYAVPALGGEERLILEDAAIPSALPDGSLLVKRINANRQNQYFRFHPSSGQIDALAAFPATNLTPMVPLPNGHEAVFYGRTTTESNDVGLFVLELESGRARRIAEDTLLPHAIRSLQSSVWPPDATIRFSLLLRMETRFNCSRFARTGSKRLLPLSASRFIPRRSMWRLTRAFTSRSPSVPWKRCGLAQEAARRAASSLPRCSRMAHSRPCRMAAH